MDNIGKLRNMASIYLRYEDKILLLYRQGSKVINNMWIGSAGGHFEEWELNDAGACVLRELAEELAITEDMLCNPELRYITLRCYGGEIRQNYYFFADLAGDFPVDITSNEGIARWFPLDEIAQLPMPFSAKHMIEHYLETGRYNHLVYVGVGNGEQVIFTELTEA